MGSSGECKRGLKPKELEELGRCEIYIEQAIGVNFIEQGTAWRTIQRKRLYLATHKSFREYCDARWGVPSRTVYQKIQAVTAFENVRNCAHFPPENEFQARSLAKLPKDKQQEVWCTIVDQAGAPQQLTGAMVESVVKTYSKKFSNTKKVKAAVSCTHGYELFQGIDWIGDINNNVSQWRVEQSGIHPLQTQAPTSNLVLVSPSKDLFGNDVSAETINQLCEWTRQHREWRFLIWTAVPHKLLDYHWPPHAELGCRIRRSEDLDRLREIHPVLSAQHAVFIWFDPAETMYGQPDSLQYSRYLIGPDRPRTDVNTSTLHHLRSALAFALRSRTPIHLRSELLDRMLAGMAGEIVY